jgi:sulfoxide reductase catalytic subunit YedY
MSLAVMVGGTNHQVGADMLIKRHESWMLPERAATPEHVFFNRRQFLAGAGAGIAGAALPLASAGAETPDPTADLYPAKRNPAYTVQRAMTPEDEASTYNNFYEFGSHKRISRAAQALQTRPWEVRIEGMVEQERTVDIDTLIRAMPLEERVYRFRCVEAWAMTVPWTGFPLQALVNYARPSAGAKYLVMETFQDPKVASGQKQFWYPWPYLEGLTLEEAANEMAFIATGVYGKPLPKQFGAPIRLVVPWKYGFKNIKSLVKFTFTDKRPVSFWERINAKEYGFWANVNPKVPHPRWSQAQERILGSDDRVPTQLYNGYGEQVASLYANIKNEFLFK